MLKLIPNSDYDREAVRMGNIYAHNGNIIVDAQVVKESGSLWGTKWFAAAYGVEVSEVVLLPKIIIDMYNERASVKLNALSSTWKLRVLNV